jgi:hypothetical protein
MDLAAERDEALRQRVGDPLRACLLYHLTLPTKA